MRPQFEAALALARQIKAHAPHCRVILTVYEMKRLGRDAAELTTLADHLTAHGLVLEMLAGPPGRHLRSGRARFTHWECEVEYVAHYGWHYSTSRPTPTGFYVIGIDHDQCSSPTGSYPGGYDFTAACEMHDFGYGVTGNYYKKAIYYNTPDKKTAVDEVFYTTLLDHTCASYAKNEPFSSKAAPARRPPLVPCL